HGMVFLQARRPQQTASPCKSHESRGLHDANCTKGRRDRYFRPSRSTRGDFQTDSEGEACQTEAARVIKRAVPRRVMRSMPRGEATWTGLWLQIAWLALGASTTIAQDGPAVPVNSPSGTIAGTDPLSPASCPDALQARAGSLVADDRRRDQIARPSGD